VQIVNGINSTRANAALFPQQVFTHVGDILATPQLTDHSPFLSGNTNTQNDAVYEWLPQQTMSLLTLGGPRFVIYSYGQTLKPAPGSIYNGSGPFFGLCTNYQVTAEIATRAVVRMDPVLATNSVLVSPVSETDYSWNGGALISTPVSASPLQLSIVTTNYSPVVENFNILPPD
jgi:hypothetical protein